MSTTTGRRADTTRPADAPYLSPRRGPRHHVVVTRAALAALAIQAKRAAR